MSDSGLYLSELIGVEVSNKLYDKWIWYARTITRDDALFIARNGLTHQARAIRSMIRQALSGRKDIRKSLYVKLDVLVNAAAKTGVRLRSRPGRRDRNEDRDSDQEDS